MSEVLPAPLRHGMRFGRWRLDLKRLVLKDAARFPRGYGYEIDLERCRTSAEVLNWIAQLRKKTWTSAKDIGDLVEALDRVLGLQQYLCGGGTNCGPLDAKAHIGARARR